MSEVQGAAKSLRESLLDSQSKATELGQGLGAAEIEIDSLRGRLSAVDATLASTRLEHEMGLVLWQQRAEQHRDEATTLKSLVDQIIMPPSP